MGLTSWGSTQNEVFNSHHGGESREPAQLLLNRGKKNVKGRDWSLAPAGQRSGQASQATLKKHPDVPGGVKASPTPKKGGGGGA